MHSPIEITGLYTYPVKSCRGLSHASMTLDGFGPPWDRRWMLVRENGEFITQRGFPRLARVTVEVAGGFLRASVEGRPDLQVPLEAERSKPRPVVVWKDTCEAWDEGEAAASWFSNYLGLPLRLVRMMDGHVRPANRKWVSFDARVSFADGFPILLANESSLEDLNRRLALRGAQPVTMDRFRPNIVIRGAPAWAEDGWKQIRVGSLLMDVVKPCVRCVMITTDQHSGNIPEPGEPLAALAGFRRWENGVIFAQNVVHRGPGTLAAGDVVEVIG